MELADRLRESVHPELLLHSHGYCRIAGVDEAGRGPLAGPVIAAAVIFPKDFCCCDIRDSKTLTAAQREKLFQHIQEHAIAWNWAYSPAEEIDRINILQATLLAMKRAVERLPVMPDYTIIDGPHRLQAEIPHTAIIDGDAKSLPISAASIMAKVVRDAIMKKYHLLYPHYNFAGNKGYGTREHLRALEQHGCCPIHRRTFSRVPR
jgi:ribonuclease HII